ncbi:nitroreductase family deazaflavin-dependent oxidoreductase [Dactylosporangium matsuzakiense]|uniref:Deazaflavin-dependent oxidoreductase (Nitroreductase family) n=1 Tax=Dactylosporangium matsuzakiense TaxID=53360 RepID=A0A9W6KFU2_9ACTN|nr:nitroreductase family deazaflavin-dependent oxidoreductase [Dactylosporangium matsuzakiense]UWZ42255.1 nitroreductase family deazaflavin-dependent oxidoreductase [Dactylosporangium matsuzakiense]GLK99909.1 hypothetical protein GCM10017581_016500 [Dactylosporangium matsuzakiense]
MTRRIPRRLARAPVALYRHGLGWLLGQHLAMIEHRGRISGRPRLVVLEVLAHDDTGLTVVSGYGRDSQWLRNIVAKARVRIWTGRRQGVPAVAEVLPPDESRQLLQAYVDRHPTLAAALGRVLGLDDLRGRSALPADVAARLPVVEIRYCGSA